MSTHGVYSFPLLKLDQILQCIRGMQIPVTEEEIRSGNPQAIRRILEVFIETIMGISKEELSQPAFSGLSALNYPELHEESIPELAFFRATMKMMNACGINDFSIRDIVKPEPKRIRRQLSAIINFAKFREERMSAFSELTAETEVLLEKKTKAEEEEQQLNQQLQTLLSQQSAEEPAKLQLQEDCKKLEEEINELNQEQAALRHQTTELKTKNNQLRDEIASRQYKQANSREELEKLKAQIISSPERFKKEISDAAETLEEAKEELNALEKKEREHLAYFDVLIRSEKDLSKTISYMEEIEIDYEKSKKAKRELKEKKKLIEANTTKTEDLIDQRQRLNKQLQQKTESIEHYRHQTLLKLKAAEHALNAATIELQELSSDQKSSQRRVIDTERELHQLLQKKNDKQREYEGQIQEILELQKDLEDVVLTYNKKIIKAIDEDTP